MSREHPGEDAGPEHLERSAEAIGEAKAAASRAEDVIGDPEGGWEAEPAGDSSEAG